RLHSVGVDRVQRDRAEEALDLLSGLRRGNIGDRRSGEAAPDSVHRASRNLQGRPPGRLERHRTARASDGWIETADGRFAATPRDPLDEPDEMIEPRVEDEDTRKLEDTAERRSASTPSGS